VTKGRIEQVKKSTGKKIYSDISVQKYSQSEQSRIKELTRRQAICFSKTEKKYFRGSFQFSIVIIQKISPPWKPEI